MKHIIVMALMALAFAGCAKQQPPPTPQIGLSPAQLLQHNRCIVDPTLPGCS